MLRTFALGEHSLSGWDHLWWEDDQHILFNDSAGQDAQVLVRCSTDGACDRAAGPVSDGRRFSHRTTQYIYQRDESATAIAGTGPVVRPASLPVGSRARSAYLVGREIHAASGAIVHLPASWPTHSGTYPLIKLVGQAGGAYYVYARSNAGRDVARLYRVTASSVHLVDSTFLAGYPILDWYLTSDDRRIVRFWNDGYDYVGEEVMDLRGRSIAQHDDRGDSTFNGASSTDLWYTRTGEGGPTSHWSIGTDTVTALQPGGYLAVPDRDLLFTAPGLGIGPGVTSLSQAGALTWEEQFRAVAVSPDGTKVLGYQGFTERPGPTVQIRNLSDGSLVRSFRFPAGGIWGDIWWESNGSVLLSYTTGDTWLIRCTTAGTCHRVARNASESLSYTHRAVPTWHEQISH